MLVVLHSGVMLVIALQFYPGDFYRSMKLALLLRDLEPRRRDDVALLFVRTSELVGGRILEDVMSRCSEIFRAQSVVLGPDTPGRRERWPELNRWPVGCNVLWQGAVDHFLNHMDPRWSSFFSVDGGDSVPLCREWLDVLVEDHAETVRRGLGVTGQVAVDGLGRWGVNLNAVYERSFFLEHPEVGEMPAGPDVRAAIDTYRAPVILPACRGSTVIRSDWKMVGVRREHFSVLSGHSAWWHGCKDGALVETARRFIAEHPEARPVVLDHGRALDVVAGGVDPRDPPRLWDLR